MSLAARTTRNTVLVTGSRLASKGIVLYVFILIARSISPADLGRFSLLTVTSSIVSVVVDIGLRPLFIREAVKDRSRLTPYLNSILSLKLVMAVPAFLVLLVAIRFQRDSDHLLEALVPTLVLMLGASFANQTRAVFYVVGDLRYEAMTTVSETLVLLAGTILAAATHQPWPFYIWAYAASWWSTAIISMVMAATRMGHRFAFDLNIPRLTMLARESLPFALTFIITTLYYKLDQPLMGFLGVTSFSLGLYAAAYRFLDAAGFVPQAIMDPVFPALSRISHEAPERLASVTSKAYKVLAAAAVPVGVTLTVMADPIIRFGAPREYGVGNNAAVTVLRVLGIGVLFLFTNNAFIYTLNAMGRQIESTRLAVLSLVVNVGLNVVLIPQSNPLFGGIVGAAWATAITELALFIGGYVLLRRYLVALPVISTVRGVIPSGLLAAAVMAGVGALLRSRVPAIAIVPGDLLAATVAAMAGVLAYAGGLLATHAFTPEEIALAREGLLSRTAR